MQYIGKYRNTHIAECIKSLAIVQLIVIACQLIYLNLFFGGRNIPLCEEFSQDDEKIHLSEYKSQRSLVVFVAGLYYQDYSAYMNKIYTDLQQYESIREKYLFMVYENVKLTNFEVSEPFSRCLEKIIDKYDLDEIIMLGFSAGGVVASNIITKIKKEMKKCLITYDCPLDIYSMMMVEHKSFTRLDAFFYMIVYLFHKTGFCMAANDTIRNCVLYKGDEPAVFELVMDKYSITKEELISMSVINTEQDENTRVYIINTVGDPVFKRNIRDSVVEKIKGVKSLEVFEKPWIGHCSDVAFNTKYLTQLKHILLEAEAEIQDQMDTQIHVDTLVDTLGG